ncbi:hypothetical protein [Streptomyces sp. PAL114]|uniref:hypothetical protein n=1 Tax=Streptomyces sp. PAL114 TaxID=2970893 RepID=UPI0028FD57E3|nr:hypothetical protein [Streptomyces sp. PAL114]MDU0305033.1 hypothetical protein [Streptomyces sp. PAL114]
MTAVHGQPVTVGGVTVVPVAAVGFGFGFGCGFGGDAGREVGAARTTDGGAGRKIPWLIEIRDGAAACEPVRAPWRDVALPLWAVVLANAPPKAIRALRQRRRCGRGREGELAPCCRLTPIGACPTDEFSRRDRSARA